MRTLITVVILSLISHLAVGQKNFEGKIIYEPTDTTVIKGKTEIYFGKKKIRIKEISLIENLPFPETRITDFEKEITYHLDEKNKTYYEERSRKRIDTTELFKSFPSKNKKVLNYNCSAYQSFAESDTAEINFIPNFQICLWYADSIYYIVDEKHRDIIGLEKATNGVNIGMGLEIIATNPGYLKKIITEPVLISQEQMPDSLFLVPADYKLKTEWEFIKNMMNWSDSFGKADFIDVEVQVAVDSALRIIDSVVTEMNKVEKNLNPNNKHQKSPSKNTHTQPTKSSAIKPKQ